MTFHPCSAPSSPASFAPDWRPTAVVFDCDGVLMDTERTWVTTIATVCRDLGIASPEGMADQLTALPASTIAEEIARRELSERAGGGAVDDAELHRRGQEILGTLTDLDVQRIEKGVDLIPGAMDLVREVSEVLPVAVASNSTASILDAKLESAGYKKYIETWVSADDVAHGKPAPDMYLEAIERLSGTPELTLTFEDSAPGATAAVAAGTRVVVLSEELDRAPEAHFATTSFEDPDFRAAVRSWLTREG